MSSDVSSNTLVQNDSTLVMGSMGVGTFLVLFFFIVMVIVWMLSMPCSVGRSRFYRM